MIHFALFFFVCRCEERAAPPKPKANQAKPRLASPAALARRRRRCPRTIPTALTETDRRTNLSQGDNPTVAAPTAVAFRAATRRLRSSSLHPPRLPRLPPPRCAPCSCCRRCCCRWSPRRTPPPRHATRCAQMRWRHASASVRTMSIDASRSDPHTHGRGLHALCCASARCHPSRLVILRACARVHACTHSYPSNYPSNLPDSYFDPRTRSCHSSFLHLAVCFRSRCSSPRVCLSVFLSALDCSAACRRRSRAPLCASTRPPPPLRP